MKNTPCVIFDFDGTIADSFDMALQVFNSLATSLELSQPDPVDKTALRKMRSHEVLHHLGIPTWKIPQTLLAMRKQLKQHLAEIPPCQDIECVLQHCHTKGYRTGILSSNAKENIERYITIHHLPQPQFIHSESSLFGKHRPLKKILQAAHTPSQCIYIGDETRDIEAAKKAGCHSIAVSWGFCHKDTLQQSQSNALADSAQALITAIDRLSQAA